MSPMTSCFLIRKTTATTDRQIEGQRSDVCRRPRDDCRYGDRPRPSESIAWLERRSRADGRRAIFRLGVSDSVALPHDRVIWLLADVPDNRYLPGIPAFRSGFGIGY